MNFPDQDNKVFEIIEEIESIQKLPYNGWFGTLGMKIRLDELHTQLDNMGYAGDRPPRKWSFRRPERNKPN